VSWTMGRVRCAAFPRSAPPGGRRQDDGGQQARLVCWEWDRKREPRGPRPAGLVAWNSDAQRIPSAGVNPTQPTATVAFACASGG
jgi:hypothetical protein